MSGEARLLALTARTAEALEDATDRLADRLDRMDEAEFAALPAVSEAARTTSPPGTHRRALAASGAADAARRLRKRDPRRVSTGVAGPEGGHGTDGGGAGPGASRVFLFSGVGDQYAGLGAGLYRCLPVFREELDRCFGLLAAEHGLDLRPVLFPAAPDDGAGPGADAAARPDLAALFDRRETVQEIHRTVVAQPLMFSVQYAMARALTALGAGPTALAGYSVGEYAAACVAGVLPLPDALRLVGRRARLVDGLPEGAMLAVMAGPEAVLPYVGGELSAAAFNGPQQTVLSGPVEAVEKAAGLLTEDGHACRRLATSHAFHSWMTEPLTGPLEELLGTLPLRPPELPVLSNVTGTWLRDEEATSPAYWARQLSRTIRFAEELAEIWRLPDPLLVELGPGQPLTRLALQHPGRPPGAVGAVVQSLPGGFDSRSEHELLLAALGRFWVTGVDPDWTALRLP
ncbi:acyltransferase domain-containing protein [Streptomyces sp. JL2001]|uniref:acyltransferase domain-containing protein n=1 Tax=Streptomyces sp. JL2001 TaxID=3342488 RepID=UPI003D805E8A